MDRKPRENQTVITWTPEKLERLKKAHASAEGETFFFEDEGEAHEFVVGYAKYLIQYLEGQLG